MFVDMSFDSNIFKNAREKISDAILTTIEKMVRNDSDSGKVTLTIDISIGVSENEETGYEELYPLINYKVTQQITDKEDTHGVINTANIRIDYNGKAGSVEFDKGLNGQTSMDI